MYQFLASDPEGSAVVFNMDAGPQDASLSPAGLLVWRVSFQELQSFTFSLTDDCNAETKVSVEVRSIKWVKEAPLKVLNINIVSCDGSIVNFHSRKGSTCHWMAKFSYS